MKEGKKEEKRDENSILLSLLYEKNKKNSIIYLVHHFDIRSVSYPPRKDGRKEKEEKYYRLLQFQYQKRL